MGALQSHLPSSLPLLKVFFFKLITLYFEQEELT